LGEYVLKKNEKFIQKIGVSGKIRLSQKIPPTYSFLIFFYKNSKSFAA
jgi:hypothetical protein